MNTHAEVIKYVYLPNSVIPAVPYTDMLTYRNVAWGDIVVMQQLHRNVAAFLSAWIGLSAA